MKAQIGLFLIYTTLIILTPIITIAFRDPGMLIGHSSEESGTIPIGISDSSAIVSANSIPKVNNHPEEIPVYSPIDNGVVFNILNESSGEVEQIPAYDYVVGAVACEMPATFHPEALKAQAIASYTYALYNRELNRKANPQSLKGADFRADPDNYIGYMSEKIARRRFGDNFDSYYSSIRQAVSEVFPKAIFYQDEPIVATYHAISPGITESSENTWGSPLPYLIPVESSGDIISDGFNSKAEFTESDLKKIILTSYPAVEFGDSAENLFSEIEKSASGTVLSIKVGDKKLRGSDVRTLFGLRSSAFDVTYENNLFVFSVRGYGHGVGLSQVGADAMAKQGYSHSQILEHYYTGIEIR